jgi:Family of unknown function (DUF5996)
MQRVFGGETEDRVHWPPLPLDEWEPTRDTLHMWTQIVGKTRLKLSPWVNHWWHVAMYVTPRGLTTSAIPYPHGRDTFEVEFDFHRHVVAIRTSTGVDQTIGLYPRSVADFYAEYMTRLKALGVHFKITTKPSEVPDPIPFDRDETHASYDGQSAKRFWQALADVDRVFHRFRSSFIGKCSPVHFFWGSFDLAVSRFPGRRAKVQPGADPITREGYSHETISVGFWPGDRNFRHAAFYSYTHPKPRRLDKEPVRPREAFYGAPGLKMFLLKYDDVRATGSPEDAVLDFCQSTYEAGARLRAWDRERLERQPAAP